MKRAYQTPNIHLSGHYILTGSTRISDLNLDEMYDDTDYNWLEKSKRLQARRWRKIKHQLV